jgi:hypothetical protein
MYKVLVKYAFQPISKYVFKYFVIATLEMDSNLMSIVLELLSAPFLVNTQLQNQLCCLLVCTKLFTR